MKERVVVVPTYNEAENIEAIAAAVLSLDPPVDLLVVDDGSPDGTGEIVDGIAARNRGRVHVLHRAGKLGLGTAYLAGFAWGLEKGYEAIAQMDADFSHDPRVLPRLFAALTRRDLAIGSRYVAGGGTENWGLARKIISRGGSLYARLILGLPLNDVTGGFKAWRRETLLVLELPRVKSNGYCFQVEMTYRAFRRGARIREVPITFVDRRVGQSKMSKAIVLEALWRVPLLPFKR